VSRLVLAEPAGGFDESLVPPNSDGASIANSIRSALLQAVEYIRRGEIENGLRHFLDFTGGPGSWERRSPERQELARDNAFTMIGDVKNPLPLFSKETLQKIKVPTLLLHGENTEPMFKKILGVMEVNIANVKRATILSAAHVMNRDNPADFNAKVIGFLKAAT
jgi:esterase